MACASEPESGARGGSCCGGCSQPFPWLSVVTDPTVARLFLQRYRLELFRGAAAGLLAGGCASALEPLLGPLGPLLHGPWLRFHAAALVPAAMAAGILVSLRAASKAPAWASILVWAAALWALGGLANGLMDLGGAFLAEGGLAHPLVLAVLGPVLAAAAHGLSSLFFRSKG